MASKFTCRSHPTICLPVPFGPETPGAPLCPGVETVSVLAGSLWGVSGGTVFSGVTPGVPTPASCWNDLHPESSDPKAYSFRQSQISGCSASRLFLATQNLAVTQVLIWGYICARCSRGKNNHSGYSFQTKECPASSEKGILFCIWLLEQSGRECLDAKMLEFWIFGFLWE